MTIWTPQNADTKRFALRLTLFTAILAAVAVGGWFLSTAAHSAAPAGSGKCKCIIEKGLSLTNWKAGQADYRELTFVTNEEKKCKLYAKVSYNDPSEAHIRPESHTWVPMSGSMTPTSMSHDFVFSMQPKMGRHHFALYADGKGPAHTFVPHPGDNDDALNGRNNEPMKIEIRFLAIFKCPRACADCPNSCPYASGYGGEVSYDLRQDLKQDGIDQMRQEYVDHAIDLPSRSDFIAATDTFYTTRDADYAYMIGEKLAGYRRAWAEKCTEVKIKETGDPNAKVEASDLIVNSGYRNPEHNDHVYKDPKKANKTSEHQYGIALDVRNIDLDGDGEVIKGKDGPLMERAAWQAGAGYADWTRYNTITHADWR